MAFLNVRETRGRKTREAWLRWTCATSAPHLEDEDSWAVGALRGEDWERAVAELLEAVRDFVDRRDTIELDRSSAYCEMNGSKIGVSWTGRIDGGTPASFSWCPCCRLGFLHLLDPLYGWALASMYTYDRSAGRYVPARVEERDDRAGEFEATVLIEVPPPTGPRNPRQR